MSSYNIHVLFISFFYLFLQVANSLLIIYNSILYFEASLRNIYFIVVIL